MDSLEREAQERKKKAVALATLPLCLGFFVWRLQSTTSAAPPPKAPPPPVVDKAAPVVAAAVGPVRNLQKTLIVSVPVGSRDPFLTTYNLAPPDTKPSTTPTRMVITEPRPGTLIPLPSLHSFGAPPPAGVLAPAGPMLAPAPSATPAAPSGPVLPVMPYTLTGIVQGVPDVAILRHVDGTRRIARVGDRLDDRYQLASIGDSSVVLNGDHGLIDLTLGGDLPVPPAK